MSCLKRLCLSSSVWVSVANNGSIAMRTLPGKNPLKLSNCTYSSLSQPHLHLLADVIYFLIASFLYSFTRFRFMGKCSTENWAKAKTKKPNQNCMFKMPGTFEVTLINIFIITATCFYVKKKVVISCAVLSEPHGHVYIF